MKTTHGAAAAAEMASMEAESGKSGSTSTKTFKDAKSAIKNAKKLLDEGEISKADFARIEKKMVADDQEGDLRAWLDKTYGKERS